MTDLAPTDVAGTVSAEAVATPLLEARSVAKRFGGVQALAGVDLSLMRGEVHCLVGENGAGKSTLGKIIAGVIQPDAGTVAVGGRPVSFRGPRDALREGITIVEQELALVPAMSVVENVLLGVKRADLPDGLSGRRYVAKLNDDLGLELDIDATVERLPIAEQQKVEILRALARRASAIVMDEPTARLAKHEAENLLAVMRRLSAAGTAIVYVSHFLEEVLSIATRVTVLRNGALVTTVDPADATPDSLVTLMLGREATLAFPPRRLPPADAPEVLSVRELAGDGAVPVHDVTLSVRRGEIVALAGLVGSGRSEVARLIFGADRRAHGVVALDGEPIELRSPREAIRHGIAFLPESRKDQGLFLAFSSRENVTLPHVEDVSPLGVIARRAEWREAAAVLERVGVNPSSPGTRVDALSGGNQQKVMFAKWLWRTPRLLIVDEPTRGVDVGAKAAIYELLVGLAAEGMAILLVSSELEEVLGLAHRVVVMRRGRPAATLEPDRIAEDAILRAAFGSDDAAGAPAGGGSHERA